MQTFSEKKRAAIIIAILTTATILFQIPLQGVQGQIVGQIGTSPSNVYGYPKLGPLPSGVTPAFTFNTYAFVSVSPNPIGVGQQALVNVWTVPGVPAAYYRQGYRVTIQKPDGTSDTIGPFNSYFADCTAWLQYKVDQVGTYRFKFDSAGTYLPAGQYVDRPGVLTSTNDTLGSSIYYGPSSTEWQNLTVQENIVSAWPGAALPTEYWSRPVSPMNREWWPILGGYPWTGIYFWPDGTPLYSTNDQHYTAYVQGPNTAHILWRRQGANSGLMGGDQYQYSMTAGGGTPAIIYNGRCYQTVTKAINGVPTSVWECYDLQTGQVYWDLTGITAPTHIIYELSSSAQAQVAGSEASNGYTVSLIAVRGEKFYKYNPYTGATTLNTATPNGFFDLAAYYGYPPGAGIYNNSYCLTVQTLDDGSYRLINWNMAGTSKNFASRIISNITWPYQMNNEGDPSIGAIDWNAGITAETYWAGMLTSDQGMAYALGYEVVATDLNTGKLLWDISANDTSLNVAADNNMISAHGKVATAVTNGIWAAWDLRTGQLSWKSEPTNGPWGTWFPYYTGSYEFNSTKGAIITSTYEGVYAIDWDNGKIIWRYTDSNAIPFESPYLATPYFSSVRIADGKVYIQNLEHTPSQPLTRDWKLHCINATTGELVWKIAGSMVPGAIADGYLTASNTFDGYTYVFGKGKSATTVTAPDTGVPQGTAIKIRGTIMDMSPGDQGSFQNPVARLDSPTKPGTVPCVNAASMSTQMAYLYQQQPIDGIWHNETLTGVPVTLTAIDANGQVTDIGTTTSNGYYGTFSFTWTPPSKGDYTLIASFAGDESYGSSAAATDVTISAASTATTTPSPTPSPAIGGIATNSDILLYIAVATISIIVAIAIVGALILRKR